MAGQAKTNPRIKPPFPCKKHPETKPFPTMGRAGDGANGLLVVWKNLTFDILNPYPTFTLLHLPNSYTFGIAMPSAYTRPTFTPYFGFNLPILGRE
jgi:hypothetical protein